MLHSIYEPETNSLVSLHYNVAFFPQHGHGDGTLCCAVCGTTQWWRPATETSAGDYSFFSYSMPDQNFQSQFVKQWPLCRNNNVHKQILAYRVLVHPPLGSTLPFGYQSYPNPGLLLKNCVVRKITLKILGRHLLFFFCTFRLIGFLCYVKPARMRRL